MKDKEEKWINHIREFCFTGDTESDHLEADNALRLLLVSLGYNDLIEQYDKVKKWYA